MPEPQTNPFIEFQEQYRTRPDLFVREILGVVPDDWQHNYLMALARGERRITVRSGHGTGKSTVASWGAVWYMLTRLPVKVVVTAPNASQLFDALFAEIKVWIDRLPPLVKQVLEVKSERVVMKGVEDESFISARTSRAETPEALAGVHSANVMLIADEASGIPESVFEAAYGSMSGHSAVTILLGNPLRTSGMFYETHTNAELAKKWFRMHVSCLDSKRVSPEFVGDIIALHGIESNAYRIRVLGEFPTAEDDTVIPLELVETAISRDVTPNPHAPHIWGLDVARFGDDYSCLVKRHGNTIDKPRTWSKLDLMQTASVVRAEYDSAGDRRPQEILVDSIGLGAGVCDRLCELGLPARGVNVSESPSTGTTYMNLRAELWFRMKEWLEKRNCRLPDDPRLREELTIVRYKFSQGSSKLQIESKDEIRRRSRRSPDVADAAVLTLASDAGTALYGYGFAGGWAKPLRRNLAMV